MKMPKLTRIAPAALVALGMMAAGNAATAAITSHDDNQANPRGWSAVAGMETSAVIELARTLPLSLSYFTSQFSFNYTALFAAVTIAVIPSIIVFAIFQEQVVSSLTAGSVKE